MRWNYYKLWQLSLLQSAMDSYYKLRQLFYYKVRHGLLQQVATGITMSDGFITNCDSTKRKELANFWRKKYFKNELKYSKRSDHVTKWSRNDSLLVVKHIVRENITFQHRRVDERSTSTTHGLVSRLLPACWLYCPLNFMPDVNCMVILKCSARPKP